MDSRLLISGMTRKERLPRR